MSFSDRQHVKHDTVLMLKARGDAGNDSFEKVLSPHGLRTLYLPVLGFTFVNADRLREKLARSGEYSGLVFTSQRAVEAVTKACTESDPSTTEESFVSGIVNAWKSKPVFVVGESTEKSACDLGLTVQGSEAGNAENLLPLITTVGYSAVAINYVTSNLNNVPRAWTIKISEAKIKQLGIRRELKQYARLTVVINEKTSFTRLLQPDIQQYDIIAVSPSSDKMFHMASTILDVDIISMDLTENLDFFIQQKHVRKATVRTTHIEISYSPLIRDRSLRKHVFSNAMDITVAKGNKIVLVTSGCETAEELRSPKDVMNLGMLFGLSETEAKDALTVNARAVVSRGKGRGETQRRAIKLSKIVTAKTGDPRPPLPVLPKFEEPEESDSDSDEAEDAAEIAEVQAKLAEEENGESKRTFDGDEVEPKSKKMKKSVKGS